MEPDFKSLISPNSKFCRAFLTEDKDFYSQQTFFNERLLKSTEAFILGKWRSNVPHEVKYLAYIPSIQEYINLNDSEISFENDDCFMFDLPYFEDLGIEEEKKIKVLKIAAQTKITTAKMNEPLYDDYSTEVLIEKESVLLVLGVWVKENDFGSNSGFAVLDFENGICLSLDSSYLEIIDKGIVPRMPEIHPQ